MLGSGDTVIGIAQITLYRKVFSEAVQRQVLHIGGIAKALVSGPQRERY